ncbi:MAG TPA: galactose-1-phosphate uridylyltransferase [Chitinophagales bacterium]|nr:galactose-1-phosphate uridylyltransferase [Chitinophagales bacterium]
MPEFRWNPLLDTWTMVATNRQHRPHLPKDYCPFCPTDNKALPKYDVLAYENDFPVMSLGKLEVGSPKSEVNTNTVFKRGEAVGKCEVILYSPEHDKQLHQLSDAHVLKIVELWSERFKALAKDTRVKYIFEFENRGEEVGVTIHHPHGQLYAYSFIPVKIREELANCKKYFQKHKRNLFADLNKAEKKHKKRIVLENKSFVAYIPYFTDYPFGVFVVNKKLKGNITQFTPAEKKDLADMLKKLNKGFDKIYDRQFPYMMCLHQTPVNEKKYADAESYYAFHIEFYPPLRAADKIKWYAGSEMGAGAAANPLDVDDCAAILRDKINQ